MTIEATLQGINDKLGRIAETLEALTSAQGVVPDAPEEPAKPAAKKKKVTKKKAVTKKKVAKKKTVGKKAKPKEPGLDLSEDVRPIAKRLRAEVSPAALKSLLKQHGASTLQNLDASKYQRFIDDALAQIGEEEDEDVDDIDDFDEDEDLDDDLDDDDDL